MMNPEELKTRLSTLNETVQFEESPQWLTLQIDPAAWLLFAQQLKQEPDLNFDYLFCLTCVDWKTHLTVVYHLTSTIHRHTLAVKIKLERIKPEVESVSSIWRTAEFHEREQYEMFGVRFLHHPDLRLLILPDGWEGKNPMRKDFEDPVNMIRL